MNTAKSKKSDIVPANLEQKISIFKKLKMYLWAKNNRFKVFKRTNKYWKFYTSFLEDIFNFGLCGAMIASVFFIPSIITFGLAFGAALWIYSNKIHTLVLQVLSSLNLVKVGNNK